MEWEGLPSMMSPSTRVCPPPRSTLEMLDTLGADSLLHKPSWKTRVEKKTNFSICMWGKAAKKYLIVAIFGGHGIFFIFMIFLHAYIQNGPKNMILGKTCKTTWKPFKYIFLSLRTFCIFFFFKEKTLFSWPPSPFTVMSPTIICFYAFSICMKNTNTIHRYK